MTAKQIPYDFWVVRAHHQLEGASLALLLRLLVVPDVAANEHEDNENNEGCLHEDAAKMHGEADEGAGCESHTGCDKPSTDDTQHTCYAEYGTLTAPSLVGKRRTHGYHEGYVGGRERQLEVGTDGDEHGSQYQVDGCANHVEGCAFLQLYIVLVEAAVDPQLQRLGHEAVEP